MAAELVVHAELNALLEKIGNSKIGFPTDGTRSYVLSKVMAAFDIVDVPAVGETPATTKVVVSLRLRNTADALQWPFVSDPSQTFDFSKIVGDV